MAPARTLAASRGLKDRELKLEAKTKQNRASAVIRNVNFNSYKEIAGKVSTNLNKELDFNKFTFDGSEKLAPLPWLDKSSWDAVQLL